MLSSTHDHVKDQPLTPSLGSRIFRIEWLGQTTASICWIISVFAYGLNSTGDFLQLSAASAWLIANIAAAANYQKN